MAREKTGKEYGLGVYTAPVVLEGEHRILTIGDTHFTNLDVGRHKDYYSVCKWVCDVITEKIRETGATVLIFTGDIIGVEEKNIRKREAFLYFMMQFKLWNELTDGRVYATIGNHDASETLTDCEILISLGYIKTPESLEFNNTKIHFIHYGDLDKEVQIAEGKYNVAIVHDTLTVGYLTNWLQPDRRSRELSTLTNLEGIQFMIAGHVHIPSERSVSTSIGDTDIALIYLGNPTRPRRENKLWEQCIFFLLEDTEEGTDGQALTIDLLPIDDLYYEDLEDYKKKQEENSENLFDTKELSNILQELAGYDLTGNQQYKDKLQQRGRLDPPAYEVALRYVEQAERSLEK